MREQISKSTADKPCDFGVKYDELCRQFNLIPLSSVKIKLNEGVIDLDTDNLRFDDWSPLCGAIGTCKTLRSIIFRSQFYNTPSRNLAEAERRNVKRSLSASKRPPIFQSKELLAKICLNLKDCLTMTTELVLLDLNGLPFRRKDLSLIAQGLAKCKSIVRFRLTNSPIGDDGLEILSRHLNQSPKIREVDFSACSLTSHGAQILADLIKQQGFRRHNCVWQESLRYQNPTLDHMSGLRRITINQNPLIGDKGAGYLADILKEDLWIKALDLQDCSVSTTGAKAFLESTKLNSIIHIIDIRNNSLVDRDTIEKLVEQLLINCGDDRCEYKWSKLDSPKRPSSKISIQSMNNGTTMITNAYGNNVNTRKPTPTPPHQFYKSLNPSKLQRSKSTGSVSTEPHVPWRSAARASRLPGYPPRANIKSFHSSEESIYAGGDHNYHHTPRLPIRDHPNTKIQHLENRLKEERQARRQLEDQLQKILIQNGVAQRQQDRFCEVVESTFQKFQKFLDFLRSKRLGQLITMAGLDDATDPMLSFNELRDSAATVGHDEHHQTFYNSHVSHTDTKSQSKINENLVSQNSENDQNHRTQLSNILNEQQNRTRAINTTIPKQERAISSDNNNKHLLSQVSSPSTIDDENIDGD